MPFTARCIRCGFVVLANTRKMLNVHMEDHDSDSHKDKLDSRWTIAVLSHTDYGMLLNVSKLSAFWNALLSRK